MLHIVWIESLCGMEEICLHCFGLQQQQQQTRIWQYFNYFICRDFLIGFQRTTQNNFKRKQIYGSQFMKQNCQLLLLSRHSSVFVCIWGRRVMQCFFCHLCLLLPFMSLCLFRTISLLLLSLLFNSQNHVVKKFFQVFQHKSKRSYKIIFANKSSDGRTHNSFQLWNCSVVVAFLQLV